MSLFSQLFGWLFGKNRPIASTNPLASSGRPMPPDASRSEGVPLSLRNMMQRREDERNKRIADTEESLKDWIVGSICKHGALPFTWESGSDEAFVTFRDQNDTEEKEYMELQEYIIDKLEIPDAGEFRMDGSGDLYIDGNRVKAKYSSILKSIADYDESTDGVTYVKEEVDGGDKVLFDF